MGIYLSTLPSGEISAGTDRILHDLQEGNYKKEWLSRNVTTLTRHSRSDQNEGLESTIRLFEALLSESRKEDFSDVTLTFNEKGKFIVQRKGEKAPVTELDAVITMQLPKGVVTTFKSQPKWFGRGTRLTVDLLPPPNDNLHGLISITDGETDFTKRITLSPPRTINIKLITAIAASALVVMTAISYSIWR